MELLAKRAADVLEQSTKATFEGIWHNTKTTPAAMLAEMGVRAKAGFTAHYYAVLALRAFGKDTSSYDTPPLKYTLHEDGTVTLQ
jgi:hypothetical protein